MNGNPSLESGLRDGFADRAEGVITIRLYLVKMAKQTCQPQH